MNNLGKNLWAPPSDPASSEFFEYSLEFPLEKCEEDYNKVTSTCGSFASSDKFAALIVNKFLKCKELTRPASFIRVGDGEGTILFALLGRYPELTKYNLRRISRIWYGADTLVPDSINEFGNLLLESINTSDVIGGPDLGTIRKSFATRPEDLDVRGMCGMRAVYNYLSNHYTGSLKEKIWASTWYSRWLLPRYKTMFGGLPFMGLVTCYEELPKKVEHHFGIRDTSTHLVPMQASISRAKKDIGHFPLVFKRICDEINPPFQGAVYIVAAGVLSKAYCSIIKARGGIAIDIGSTADIWMGKVTRPGWDSSFVGKWKL